MNQLHPSFATAELDRAIGARKTNYWNSYSKDEQIDETHRMNYWNELATARAAALSDIPVSPSLVDSWILQYLKVDIYSWVSDVLITTEEIEETSIDLDNDQVTITKSHDVLGSGTTDQIEMIEWIQRWAESRPRDTDEVFSEALEDYAVVISSHPDQSPGYYRQTIKRKHIDRYRKETRQINGDRNNRVPKIDYQWLDPHIMEATDYIDTGSIYKTTTSRTSRGSSD